MLGWLLEIPGALFDALRDWQVRQRAAADLELVDAIIAQRGVKRDGGTRPRHHGFDPAMKQRTDQRRRNAEQLRAQAAAIESGPGGPRLSGRVEHSG